MKGFKRVVLLVMSVLLVFAASSAFAAPKKYVVGIDGDYPPYSFMGADGKPTGFDVESIQWIAKEMGFTVEIKPIAWDGIIRKSKHTHCKQGHALEGDNLIVRKNGRQTCRECSRARWRAFARKKRAQRASQ